LLGAVEGTVDRSHAAAAERLEQQIPIILQR
jgi:hypothetical protein